LAADRYSVGKHEWRATRRLTVSAAHWEKPKAEQTQQLKKTRLRNEHGLNAAGFMAISKQEVGGRQDARPN
jgi:hypothetical protein